MENIAVTKPYMGVLFQGRPTLTPFGVLSQALAQEILARAGQTEGVYPYVPLDLLEDTSEEDSRPAAPPTAAIQVELKLTLEALRAAERGERALDEAARRVLERAVQLQVRPVPTAQTPGTTQVAPADSGRAKPSAPAKAGEPAPRGRTREDKRPAAGQPAETAPVQTGAPQIAQSFYQRFYQTIHQHIRFFALLPGARAGGLTELAGAEALGSFAASLPGVSAREGRSSEALTSASALSGGGRGLSDLGGLARRTEEFSRRLRQLREEGLAPAERGTDAPWRGEGGELTFPERGEGTPPTRTSARMPDARAATQETAWAARAEAGKSPAPAEQSRREAAQASAGRGAAQPSHVSTDHPEHPSAPRSEVQAPQTPTRRAEGENAPAERRQLSRPGQTHPADEALAQSVTGPTPSTGTAPAAPGPEGRVTAEHAAPETERPGEKEPVSAEGHSVETGVTPAAAQPAQGRLAPAEGAASQEAEGQRPTAPEAELAIPGVSAPAGYAAPGGELIFPTPVDEAGQSPALQGTPQAGRGNRTESPRPTPTGKAGTDKVPAPQGTTQAGRDSRTESSRPTPTGRVEAGKSPAPAEQSRREAAQTPAGRGAPETRRPTEKEPVSAEGHPVETGATAAAQPAQGRLAPAEGAASQEAEGQGPTTPEAELAIPGVSAPAGYTAPGGELIFPTPVDEAGQSPVLQGAPQAGRGSRAESPHPAPTKKAGTDKAPAPQEMSQAGRDGRTESSRPTPTERAEAGKSPAPAEQSRREAAQTSAGRGAAQPPHASADHQEHPSASRSEAQAPQTPTRRAGEESAPAERRQPSRPGQPHPTDEVLSQSVTGPTPSTGSASAAPAPEGRVTAEHAAPETERPGESAPTLETGRPTGTGATAAQPAQGRPAPAEGAASQGAEGQRPTAPEAELAIPGVSAPAGYAAPGGELIFPTPVDEAGQSPALQGTPQAGRDSRTESSRPTPTGRAEAGKSPASAEQSRREAAQTPAGRGAAQPPHASADHPEERETHPSAPRSEAQAPQTPTRRAEGESAPAERRQPSRPGQPHPTDEALAQSVTGPVTPTGTAPAAPAPEGRATAEHAASETGRPGESAPTSETGRPTGTGATAAAQPAQGRSTPAEGAASQGAEGQRPTAPEAELAIPGVPAPAGYAAPGGELIFPTPVDEAGQSPVLQGTPQAGRGSRTESPRPAPTGKAGTDKAPAPQGTPQAGRDSRTESSRPTPTGRAEAGKSSAPAEQSRREAAQTSAGRAEVQTDRPAAGKTNAGGESAPPPAGEAARGRRSRETATAIPTPAAPAVARAAYGAVPGAELVFPTPGQDAPGGLRSISAHYRDIRTAAGAIPTVGARLTGSAARTVGLQARRLETASGPVSFPGGEGTSTQTAPGRPAGQPLSGTSPAERMAAQPQSVELTYGQAVQFPFPIPSTPPAVGPTSAQPPAWTPQTVAQTAPAPVQPDQILPGETAVEMPFPAGTPAQTAPLPGGQGAQAPFAQSVAERATALSVPGFPGGPSGGQGMIQWTAPGWQPPAVDTQFLEQSPVEHQMGVETPRTVRVSDAEIRRTADQVYRLLEDRLRRERRRLGL